MKSEQYFIEKILDRRKVNGKLEYKIKWSGYPISESTWEPMKNLEQAKVLLDKYDSEHPINTKQKNQENDTNTEDNSNSKILLYENENSYKVDGTLKDVITVQNNNGQLMAIVDKIDEKGEIFKTYISTKELRKINPCILLSFSESKIKFS